MSDPPHTISSTTSLTSRSAQTSSTIKQNPFTLGSCYLDIENRRLWSRGEDYLGKFDAEIAIDMKNGQFKGRKNYQTGTRTLSLRGELDHNGSLGGTWAVTSPVPGQVGGPFHLALPNPALLTAVSDTTRGLNPTLSTTSLPVLVNSNGNIVSIYKGNNGVVSCVGGWDGGKEFTVVVRYWAEDRFDYYSGDKVLEMVNGGKKLVGHLQRQGVGIFPASLEIRGPQEHNVDLEKLDPLVGMKEVIEAEKAIEKGSINSTKTTLRDLRTSQNNAYNQESGSSLDSERTGTLRATPQFAQGVNVFSKISNLSHVTGIPNNDGFELYTDHDLQLPQKGTSDYTQTNLISNLNTIFASPKQSSTQSLYKKYLSYDQLRKLLSKLLPDFPEAAIHLLELIPPSNFQLFSAQAMSIANVFPNEWKPAAEALIKVKLAQQSNS